MDDMQDVERHAAKNNNNAHPNQLEYLLWKLDFFFYLVAFYQGGDKNHDGDRSRVMDDMENILRRAATK